MFVSYEYPRYPELEQDHVFPDGLVPFQKEQNPSTATTHVALHGHTAVLLMVHNTHHIQDLELRSFVANKHPLL